LDAQSRRGVQRVTAENLCDTRRAAQMGQSKGESRSSPQCRKHHVTVRRSARSPRGEECRALLGRSHARAPVPAMKERKAISGVTGVSK
jgi:hypothetical protein